MVRTPWNPFRPGESGRTREVGDTMSTTLLFLAGLTLGAPPELASPKLERGLEVRWVGTFTEATFRPGVRAIRKYDVETRLFVIDQTDKGADVALFTRVFQQPDRGSKDIPQGVVRLEMARVDKRGTVTLIASPADPENPKPVRPWPMVQLQSLPVHEAGMFVELPEGAVSFGKSWAVGDGSRPARQWKTTDVESVRGVPGMRLIGTQHTANYYETRVRQSEWRRQDTLTVVPGLGYASRIERIIEKRDPEVDDLSFRSVLTLEQQGKITYPGRLYQERRDECINGAAFTAQLDRLLADGGRSGASAFESLARRIATYQSENVGSDSVPYREAILAVRKRAESAAQGNIPPAPPSEDVVVGCVIGKPVPEVTLKNALSGEEITLSKMLAKPTLLMYFQPSAPSGLPIVRLGESLQLKYRSSRTIALSVAAAEESKRFTVDHKPAIPVFDGSLTYKAHGLDATPVFILVDEVGIVRQIVKGWGAETAELLERELARSLAQSGK
jgi:hypothetical protein